MQNSWGILFACKKRSNMEKNELKEDLENKNTKEVIDNVSL